MHRTWLMSFDNEWLVAIRTPHAFELPRVCVIHHDAAVAVPVADEQFVRFGVNRKPRGSFEDLRRVASGLAALANSHHKFAFLRELENLIVIRKIRRVV